MRSWPRPRLLTATALAGALLACAAAGRAQDAADAPGGPEAAAPVDTVGAPADTAAAARIAPDLIGFESAEPDLWATGVSATAAVVMTPVFPGWGQLYAENSWRAALAYGTQMYFWTNILSRDRQARRARDFAARFPDDDPNRGYYDAIADEAWEQMRDFAWWSGGVLLIVALDAYVGAHLFNFDEDAVPVPDRWDEQFGPPGGETPGPPPPPQYTVFRWRTTF